MPYAVEVSDLWFSYDKEPVLQNINATIKEGEYIAIIGPNGGGKTTFLKLLLGLLKPQKGKILIYGKPPQLASSLIGYTPQNVHQNSDMPLRVIDVILQGRLCGTKLRFGKEDKEVAIQKAHELGIEHLLYTKIANLSGGQRQRTLIARALACEPKILVLDEPTAAIDMEGQNQIYKLLKNLPLTRIVVSHDIKILLEGVDRVFYINKELVIHDNLHFDLHPQGHFCEMELLEAIRCNHE